MVDEIVSKYEDISNRFFSSFRRKQLNNTDFSIISNNCWGGHVYRRFDLPYSSPTVGLYFFSEEYLKFVSNLEYYLHTELRFISSYESKYKDELIKRNQTKVPIGLLDDVELVFLHYKNEYEASEKWKRRTDRVNLGNLIVKNSQMNLCTDDHLYQFDRLPYKKKIAFIAQDSCLNINCGIKIKRYSADGCVKDDTTFFSNHVNLIDLINRECEQKHR